MTTETVFIIGKFVFLYAILSFFLHAILSINMLLKKDLVGIWILLFLIINLIIGDSIIIEGDTRTLLVSACVMLNTFLTSALIAQKISAPGKFVMFSLPVLNVVIYILNFHLNSAEIGITYYGTWIA